MRTCCIKSYNKYYEKNSILKSKQKGRNQDIKVKDMEDYREIKNQIAKKEEKLQEANNQTQKLDIASNDINKIFDNHEYEIVNDRRKKVKTTDEIEAMKGKKKNNIELK